MIRMLMLTSVLCLALTSCMRGDEAAPPVSGGQGGAPGNGDSGQGGSAGDGIDGRLELCEGIAVTCHDGVLEAYYGFSCTHFSGVCPLGCRVSTAGTSEAIDPHVFAQTLCVQPDAEAVDAGTGG